MRVYLLRHGPAGLKSAWSGDDSLRPLTGDGRRLMKGIGSALAAQGIEPDLIVTSPYARASKTATIVAKALGRREAVVIDPTVAPGFGAKHLLEILEAHPDATSLMVVGHDPDFSGVVADLTGGRVKLQKGGLAELEVGDDGTATLLRLEQPAHLLA